MSLLSPVSLSFPFPSHFLCLHLSHTETDTPPSPSSYSHGVSKCACPAQWGVQWKTDETCSALPWHLSEPHLSSVCKRWQWAGVTQHARGDGDAFTSLHQLLNQLHGSQLVRWLGNDNYLLRAFTSASFVMQWCHGAQTFELQRCGGDMAIICTHFWILREQTTLWFSCKWKDVFITNRMHWRVLLWDVLLHPMVCQFILV